MHTVTNRGVSHSTRSVPSQYPASTRVYNSAYKQHDSAAITRVRTASTRPSSQVWIRTTYHSTRYMAGTRLVHTGATLRISMQEASTCTQTVTMPRRDNYRRSLKTLTLGSTRQRAPSRLRAPLCTKQQRGVSHNAWPVGKTITSHQTCCSRVTDEYQQVLLFKLTHTTVHMITQHVHICTERHNAP